MEGFQVHSSKVTFPYNPSGSNEKMNLLVRNEYKIHETYFLDTFLKVKIKERKALKINFAEVLQ